jgi:hypothetical protein
MKTYLWWDLKAHTPQLGGQGQEKKNHMMFNVPRKRRSNVLQQRTLDKENIPPQIAIASIIQKPTRMRRGFDAYPRGKWTNQ